MLDPTIENGDSEWGELLTDLKLDKNELHGLLAQGFVSEEFRDYKGRKLGPYFKLRFRVGHQQRVRYLGKNRERAEQIGKALESFRRSKVIAREVATLAALARKHLRNAKKEMATGLAKDGRYFHGYAIRRRRN